MSWNDAPNNARRSPRKILRVDAVSLGEGELLILYSNFHYFSEADA